jgi:hypothetical protein
MPIIRRRELAPHLVEFDDRCQRLRDALIGGNPNPNVFRRYALNPDDFRRDFTELDARELDYAIDDLIVSLKALKKVKRLEAPPLGA